MKKRDDGAVEFDSRVARACWVEAFPIAGRADEVSIEAKVVCENTAARVEERMRTAKMAW